MKLFLFMTLLVNVFFPWGIALGPAPGSMAVALLSLAVKIGLLCCGIALLETLVAKLRLFRVPELLSASMALALLALLSFFFVR